MIAWRLEYFDELGSTSDLCAARAKAGESEGLAIQALRQTAGRGSRGRAWEAPAGNLNLSILLRPCRPAAQAGLFSLLAGVAVAEAVGQLAPNVTTMLKWPNDVLIKGAKLAGILIDAAPVGDRLDWLVIGIGLNLAAAPQFPGRATTCLADYTELVTPRKAAAVLLSRLSDWHDKSGPEIQTAWLARAYPVGTPLEVRGLHFTRSGVFAGLSPTGELLLAADDRIERISTGDVMLGRT